MNTFRVIFQLITVNNLATTMPKTSDLQSDDYT
jgi:hypothetical protein